MDNQIITEEHVLYQDTNIKDNAIIPINQNTELGESLKELNNDDLNKLTKMSGIDLRANLQSFELSNILALDSLVALKIMPLDCLAFTRQKKRLSVSLNGIGRKQIVELVAGKREQDKNVSFGDRIKGFFGGSKSE